MTDNAVAVDATLRAAIQARRRVHKTICEPFYGSLAPP